MLEKTSIKVQLYGILHRYYPTQDEICLDLPVLCTLNEMRAALYHDIQKKNPQLASAALLEIKQMVESSAFAWDEKILHANEQYSLHKNDIIAILPPVCGG